MRSQQEAERAEQQRIKNLVLNYDLMDDHDGEEPAFHYVQSTDSKRQILVGKGYLNKSLQPRNESGQTQRSTSSDENGSGDFVNPSDDVQLKRQDSFADEVGTIDHSHGQPRQDKSGNSRSKQRARKLQLGDIDWYGDRFSSATPSQAHDPVNSDATVVPGSRGGQKSSRLRNGTHRYKNKR
jgi:regulator of nonsense transcripts 2